MRRGAERAGRDPEGIELHTMVARPMVGEDAVDALAREEAESGVPAAAMRDSMLYLTGTGADVRERLQHWRDRTGISYVSLFDPGEDQIDYFAREVVAPLGRG